jgi:hypothetical protein
MTAVLFGTIDRRRGIALNAGPIGVKLSIGFDRNTACIGCACVPIKNIDGAPASPLVNAA